MNARVSLADLEARCACADEWVSVARRTPTDLPDVLAPIRRTGARPVVRKRRSWVNRILLVLGVLYLVGALVYASNRIRVAWVHWCLTCAEDELREHQASGSIGQIYLVNTLIHINHLRAKEAALRGRKA